ncbi:sigma-E processing peptidase SpoIIGA [uncultured Oscillibacter sp.]|uniref:sigma-E processing peptidase SpoIIGA n=1 Tax=uncultured Oscillibacter sp. TaxID=876091 RepID=UPI0025FE2934|nr:sigma-E processing peptidase SpoIIGA [uncultured Oscillibacter sp.]
MTVVYIDSVFFLNGIMDYLLVLATARLAGIPLRRRRYLLAALAGGLYAAAVFLPGLEFLAAGPAKAAAGVLLALLAFGGEARLLRLTLLLFLLSCGMAGAVLALGLLAGGLPMVNGVFYTDVDGRVLAVAATAGYLVVSVVFRASARQGMAGRLLPVRVSIGGRTAELTALWDSGNTLRDPADGRLVLVAAPGSLAGVLPGPVARLCTAEGLRRPAELLEPVLRAAPALRPRLVPYHAVGVAGGLLLTVRSDWTEIGGARHSALRLALSPTALGNGYTALWGGEVRKGGRDGLEEGMAAAADPAGTAAG